MKLYKEQLFLFHHNATYLFYRILSFKLISDRICKCFMEGPMFVHLKSLDTLLPKIYGFNGNIACNVCEITIFDFFTEKVNLVHRQLAKPVLSRRP